MGAAGGREREAGRATGVPGPSAGARGAESAPGATEWQGPAIGLLDLDAFFASVEQLDHPEWRGRPVIVGGDADRRGVVSTASYEARRFGVRSAMSAAQARRLCPGAVWTHGHFDRYREVSSEVMGILTDETPLVEQVSIDEAFFDVTPGRYSRESPVDICRRVQGRVAALGVTCSIGLGVCKSVAKVASEAEKPRGLTVVMPGTEADFLAPLPVRAMSGIGAAAEARLARVGIRTLGQLARTDDATLLRLLGQAGPALRARAAATERTPVGERARPAEAKSVSNERTFARDLIEEGEVTAALDAVCALVGRRLRRRGLCGLTVTVRLKSDFRTSHTAQARLDEPSDDEASFGPVARRLLAQLWRPGQPVRLLGVGVSDFSAARPRQLDLFADPEEERRREALRRLHVATDEVRERFGDDSLAYGRDLKLRGATTNTQPQHKEGA